MTAGSALFYSGKVIHGGGGYRSYDPRRGARLGLVNYDDAALML